MIHLSSDVEALAKRIASARHISVEQAVSLAVEAAARIPSKQPGRPGLKGEELIRRMEELSLRAASRPLVDARAPDELLGFDEFGLPR